MKIDELRPIQKLKVLKMLNEGIEKKVVKDFLNYFTDDEKFIIAENHWCEVPEFYVNGSKVNKETYNVIKLICKRFFNEDEYFILICPKGC
jgi:hypothetical protein